MTRANEIIRAARERLGFTQQDAATRAGLSIYEYADLEQHADELATAVSLATARRVCDVLSIALSDLLAAEQLLAPRNIVAISSTTAPSRHRLAQEHRVAKGASRGDVANAIGFEEGAITLGESSDEFLESLPIPVLIEWARYIGADPRAMLGL